MNNTDSTTIMVGWTTVSKKEEAELLVEKLLELKLIACGQICGPIESHYNWDNKIIKDTEWRITLKYAKNKDEEVEQKIQLHHPYKIPQWMRVEACTTDAYGKWVNAN